MDIDDRDYMRERYERRMRQEAASAAAPSIPWKLVAKVLGGLVIVVWLATRFAGGGASVPFPPTGAVNWYFPPFKAEDAAPLTISAPPQPERNYAVKLTEWQSGRLIALIPIRAGETAELKMPLGEYQVVISEGRSWLGPEKLFGSSGEVRKAVHPLHFHRTGNQRVGHRIDLAKRPDGNFRTREVGILEKP